MAGFTVLSRTSSTIVVEDYRATIAIPMAAPLPDRLRGAPTTGTSSVLFDVFCADER